MSAKQGKKLDSVTHSAHRQLATAENACERALAKASAQLAMNHEALNNLRLEKIERYEAVGNALLLRGDVPQEVLAAAERCEWRAVKDWCESIPQQPAHDRQQATQALQTHLEQRDRAEAAHTDALDALEALMEEGFEERASEEELRLRAAELPAAANRVVRCEAALLQELDAVAQAKRVLRATQEVYEGERRFACKLNRLVEARVASEKEYTSCEHRATRQVQTITLALFESIEAAQNQFFGLMSQLMDRWKEAAAVVALQPHERFVKLREAYGSFVTCPEEREAKARAEAAALAGDPMTRHYPTNWLVPFGGVEGLVDRHKRNTAEAYLRQMQFYVDEFHAQPEKARRQAAEKVEMLHADRLRRLQRCANKEAVKRNTIVEEAEDELQTLVDKHVRVLVRPHWTRNFERRRTSRVDEVAIWLESALQATKGQELCNQLAKAMSSDPIALRIALAAACHLTPLSTRRAAAHAAFHSWLTQGNPDIKYQEHDDILPLQITGYPGSKKAAAAALKRGQSYFAAFVGYLLASAARHAEGKIVVSDKCSARPHVLEFGEVHQIVKSLPITAVEVLDWDVLERQRGSTPERPVLELQLRAAEALAELVRGRATFGCHDWNKVQKAGTDEGAQKTTDEGAQKAATDEGGRVAKEEVVASPKKKSVASPKKKSVASPKKKSVASKKESVAPPKKEVAHETEDVLVEVVSTSRLLSTAIVRALKLCWQTQ